MRFRITKCDRKEVPFGCKAQIEGNSRTIAKICNAAVGDYGLIDADHELVRGSLRARFGNTLIPGSREISLSL